MTDADAQEIRKLDVLILGGGVAGLWLLGRLRSAGYQAVLLESQRLGEGQTRFAQGIIHGGTKYSLQGVLSDSARAVADMPARWRSCLRGAGELDLSAARVLSQHHYLWSTVSLTSRMTGFLASHAMRSRSESLDGDRRPPVFRDPGFRGQVYALDEPVIDAGSLVRALAEPHRDRILRVRWPEAMQLRVDDGVHVQLRDAAAGVLELRANCMVYCAGAGNEALLSAVGKTKPAMQRRPLHMVLARGALPLLYAHCLGGGSNPRITVTTHPHSSGDAIWYMGGQLAEDGVAREPEAQIAAAQQELATLLPWVNRAGLRWQTVRVERAEPRQAGGRRPADPLVERDGPVITVWPVKLALAPLLAERVLAVVSERGARADATASLPQWSQPGYAPAPWEELPWN